VKTAILIYLILLIAALLACTPANAEMDRIESAAHAAGNAFDIDPQLILAVIEVESRFNPRAIGKSHGEIGLMQLRPEFHDCASFDVFENIRCGTRFLSQLRDRCGSECRDFEWITYFNTGYRSGLNLRGGYYQKVIQAYLKRRSFYVSSI
jgi:soluble lytic murein transglycosylase-like protein